MKILVVCYSYAPQISPRAFRWTTICEHWARNLGTDIDVVCAAAPELKEFEELNGVRVHRVGSVDAKLRKQTSGGLKAVLRFVYRATLRHFLWPDYAFMWIGPATKKASELCNLQQYDLLISVSHPFSGHMVGLALKNAKPDLNWMVDIGDPFAFMDNVKVNNSFLFGRRNFAAEKRILEQADSISVTTESTENMYRRYFPVVKDKILTIPPLYKAEIVRTTGVRSGGGKRLTFVGTLYSKIRSPKPLLEFFAKAAETQPDLELHFYGHINDCRPIFQEYKNLKNVFVHGLVPQAEARRVLQEADVIVNLGNENIYQLPSKTVECLASGKPILNVISQKEDSSVELFRDYPCLFTLHTSELPASSELLQRFRHFTSEPCQVEASWLKSKLKRFEIEAVSQAYMELHR